MEESTLSKAMLENYKCYLLDCGAEVFVWVGRVTQIEERKVASKTAEVESLFPFFPDSVYVVSVGLY